MIGFALGPMFIRMKWLFIKKISFGHFVNLKNVIALNYIILLAFPEIFDEVTLLDTESKALVRAWLCGVETRAICRYGLTHFKNNFDRILPEVRTVNGRRY